MQVAETADQPEAIVGLWKFKCLAKANANIPDGAQIDAGVATWHADGTFTLTQYAVDATTVVAAINGIVTGDRITVD